MNHVREFHPISDEKHRHVVTHKVKVTLSGVELDSKTTWIPQGLRASTLMHNGGEPNNNRGLNPRSPEKISTCKVRYIVSYFKETLGTGSSSMNNTFRDTFPVELSKLFNQMIVLKEDGSSLADGEGGVVVPDGGAGVGGPEAGVVPTGGAVPVRIHGWATGIAAGIGPWSCVAWGKGAMVVGDKDEEWQEEEELVSTFNAFWLHVNLSGAALISITTYVLTKVTSSAV